MIQISQSTFSIVLTQIITLYMSV